LKFFLKYALIVTTAFYQNGKPNDIALNEREKFRISIRGKIKSNHFLYYERWILT